MNKQSIPEKYGSSFEAKRRVHPNIWNADYCLLKGLAEVVSGFASKYAGAGMSVIDFGCGGKPYRGYFPDNCRYIGVDACENPYADLVVKPGQPVPIPDGSADLILSTQVVYLIPDYTHYLLESRRLLRPDGRMLITTHGTWTYHPASGGDYYRFTSDGLAYILSKAGLEIESMQPVVGTLGTGLHLRQLVFNSWLSHIPMGSWAANIYNVITNLRILIEDKLSPIGTKMSSPVIIAAVVRRSRITNG